MINKEEFFRAFGDYVGVPKDVTITSIEDVATYREGCPTCGRDMEYEVVVRGNHANGKRFWDTYEGKISDFLDSLD